MEVTSPNRTDNDGGYLVKPVGKDDTRFIEINEVAMEDREDFKRRFKHYNTNNLWVNLRALKRQIEAGDYGDTVIAQERVLENSMKGDMSFGDQRINALHDCCCMLTFSVALK